MKLSNLKYGIGTCAFGLMIVLMACAAPASAPAASESADVAYPAVEEYAAETDSMVDSDLLSLASNPEETRQEVETTGLAQRKIIREATLRIEVEDVTTALNQATILSARIGGYTTGSNSWRDADGRQHGSLSFAVPVDRFEEALERTRKFGAITNETVSSQDVTAQYVDLVARIGNLEVTAERVRTILLDAKELKYILEVNRELSRIEGDLEALKGQHKALAQRTSFSTIHLDLVPVPIAQSTEDVLGSASVWSPLATFNSALGVLIAVFTFGANALIWLIVVGGPVALVLWILWSIVRRNRNLSPATPETT